MPVLAAAPPRIFSVPSPHFAPLTYPTSFSSPPPIAQLQRRLTVPVTVAIDEPSSDFKFAVVAIAAARAVQP
ncbi:hypothetical protein M0R45_011315 [Rubus argutus]|uniref:Uncharacterized protein n=1 Tax=Rubus argutus TaxID=59490 RepID=A0AAW1Y9P9_RUBAR